MDITEYINLYIEEKLSSNELIEFEEKRKTDKEFDLEVRTHIKLLEVADRESVKCQLKEIEEDLFKDKTSLIDSYISGDLNKEFKRYFDSRIQIDNEFKLEVETQKQIQNHFERNSIKEQFKNIKTDLDADKHKSKPRIIKLITTYSSIAAILIIGFFVIKNTSSSNVELLSENNVYVAGSSGSLGFAGTDSLFVDILVFTDNIDDLEYQFDEKELKIYVPEIIKIDKQQQIKLQYNSLENKPYMLEFQKNIYYIDITKKRTKLE